MASSKDKAISLKDSYVAGLIEGGATAPVQGMPETDMGNIASIHDNVRTGKRIQINDGIPDHYKHDYVTGRSAVREGGREVAYPTEYQGFASLGNKKKLNYEYNEYNYQGNPRDEMGRRSMQRLRDADIRTANSAEVLSPYYRPTGQINMDYVQKGRKIKHYTENRR